VTTSASSSDDAALWRETHQARTIAFSTSARWGTIAVELMLGVVMLPFNTRYLGAEDYGLWMLAASIVAYFPVLDLGYAGAMDRFIAHYRARRDARAINEIASTLFVVFAAIGTVAMLVISLVAFNAGTLFNLSAEQVRPAQIVMLLVGVQFAVGLPFAAYGGVVNGFQRTYRNAVVGTVVAVAVAIVNVSVLVAGYGLIELVAATTATRMLGYIAYRLNGYRVFPLPLLAVPARALARGHRFQRLHPDPERQQQDQLRHRPRANRRVRLDGSGGGVDGCPAPGRHGVACDQPVERRVVPGGRGVRQHAAARAHA
jgi:hypothetical protein